MVAAHRVLGLVSQAINDVEQALVRHALDDNIHVWHTLREGTPSKDHAASRLRMQ